MQIMGKSWESTANGEKFLRNQSYNVSEGRVTSREYYRYHVLWYIYRIPDSTTEEIVEHLRSVKGLNVSKMLRTIKELDDDKLIRVSSQMFEHTTRLNTGKELEDVMSEKDEEVVVEYPFGADPNRFLLRYDEALLTEEDAAKHEGIKEYFEDRDLKGLREKN